MTNSQNASRSAAVLGRSNSLTTGRFLNFKRLGGLDIAAPEDGRAPGRWRDRLLPGEREAYGSAAALRRFRAHAGFGFLHSHGADESGGERAALQTLREVRRRAAIAPAPGVRWLQHRFRADAGF